MKSTQYVWKKVAVATAAAVLAIGFFGYNAEEGPVEELTEANTPPQPTPQVSQVVVSAAGDCTLGTDTSFGGITFPVEAVSQNGDYSYFFRNVKDIFDTDDLTIVNFEGTLTERGTRADKTFAFRGDPAYTAVLTQGSVEAVTLANNHSQDYGAVSLEDTKQYLEQAGIVWFENLNTAVMEVNGVKVGLVGLNALNGSASELLPQAIQKVHGDGAQLIIVQVHWGVESENYPLESQIELAHTAVDLGADLVIGHHPHVLQGVEKYKGKYIAYSLGNFCFGGNQNPRDKDSMIFRQTFTVVDGKVQPDDCYEIIPCSISSVSARNNYQPTPQGGEAFARTAEKLRRFSAQFGEIELNFRSYAIEK